MDGYIVESYLRDLQDMAGRVADVCHSPWVSKNYLMEKINKMDETLDEIREVMYGYDF